GVAMNEEMKEELNWWLKKRGSYPFVTYRSARG
ncbi:unnamed protein product, partial [marine sediment metagenome]